jgi:regulator of cell morphogenesis and NO signaling
VITIKENIPLGTLVRERPELASILDRLGLDYCCGGEKTLAEACREKNVELPAIQRILSNRADTGKEQLPEIDHLGLTGLVDHIVTTHHTYLRSALPCISQLIKKVIAAHGDRHPELHELADTYRAFEHEITSHMAKEEKILFPAIRRIDASCETADVQSGNLAGPIRIMMTDHVQAGEALARFRELTNDYTAPEDACESWRALLIALQELERDTHRHIHKENNILFPRLTGGTTDRH